MSSRSARTWRDVLFDSTSRLTRLARHAVEFLYPPSCRLCRLEIGSQADIADPCFFCADCLAELCHESGIGCIRCGSDLAPSNGNDPSCMHCHNENYAFDAVWRLSIYGGLLKQAILSAQRPAGEGVLIDLAELVWSLNARELRDFHADVIVPIPFFRLEWLFRSHHPSLLLAEHWGRRLNIPCAPHILKKVRWTGPQMELTRAERRTNLKNVFQAVSNSDLTGANVLIADDVLTTGTTAHEAARALVRAGAKRVGVVVVARGVGRGVDLPIKPPINPQ